MSTATYLVLVGILVVLIVWWLWFRLDVDDGDAGASRGTTTALVVVAAPQR